MIYFLKYYLQILNILKYIIFISYVCLFIISSPAGDLATVSLTTTSIFDLFSSGHRCYSCGFVYPPLAVICHLLPSCLSSSPGYPLAILSLLSLFLMRLFYSTCLFFSVTLVMLASYRTLLMIRTGFGKIELLL